jgi:hypothetical protein
LREDGLEGEAVQARLLGHAVGLRIVHDYRLVVGGDEHPRRVHGYARVKGSILNVVSHCRPHSHRHAHSPGQQHVRDQACVEKHRRCQLLLWGARQRFRKHANACRSDIHEMRKVPGKALLPCWY